MPKSKTDAKFVTQIDIFDMENVLLDYESRYNMTGTQTHSYFLKHMLSNFNNVTEARENVEQKCA